MCSSIFLICVPSVLKAIRIAVTREQLLLAQSGIRTEVNSSTTGSVLQVFSRIFSYIFRLEFPSKVDLNMWSSTDAELRVLASDFLNKFACPARRVIDHFSGSRQAGMSGVRCRGQIIQLALV